MRFLLCKSAMLLALVAATASVAAAQVVQGSGATLLRVTVLDQTDAALIIANVKITNGQGFERAMAVSDRGVAEFVDLAPGTYQVTASAESFRTMTVPYNVRRGQNQTTLRLAVASIEQTVTVQDQSAADRRDNGFTRTLTQDEIDSLPDDPDEMAEELMRMAGPGAQIFVNGFRGGRLPPKDQIQQIRFHTNSFSAEYHEAGMVRVEVITKPGLGGWRGMSNVGFRDEALNAKNAFADEKGPEQMRRYMLSFSGPIAKGKTSLSLSLDGNNSYDSRTIVAQTPAGAYNSLARTPLDAVNFSARIEHKLTNTGQLQAEYSRRDNRRNNLGVGDFDLPERAFKQTGTVDTVRVRHTDVIGKKVFSEFRLGIVQNATSTRSATDMPTIRVIDAFTTGSAGQGGERESREIELAQNFDFNLGRKHSARAGFLFEGGWWDSGQRGNMFGTYTFTSLDAYTAGRPSTYSIRTGNPNVSYSQYRAGWYFQDDFRIGKNLQASLGVRQELQTQVSDKWNISPRAAATWAATRKTTVRLGYGIFYDWYESQFYEQTIRVDGTHQVDRIVQNPSFPEVSGTGTVLPPSIIRANAWLDQPIIQQASIGLERPLTTWMDFRTDYMWTRADHSLRSINVNAPINGVRPDASIGNVTEIQSTGARAIDRFTAAINARQMTRRIVGMVMYQYANARNFADSAVSVPADSNNPDADWGPAAQDVRHRIFFNLNMPVGRGVRAGLNVTGSSALPYNITTGRDDNGDTLFNDRPAGVGRNSARGAANWTSSLRVNKSIPLGGRVANPGMPMMPPPPPPPPGGASAQIVGQGGGAPRGGDGPQMMIVEGAASRYRLDLYVNVQNLFNNVNYNQFVGSMLSPFFGTATSAGAPRRIEIGATFGF